MSWLYNMGYNLCKNLGPMSPPCGPPVICRNTPLPVSNNQSEPGGMSWRSCTHCSHPLPCSLLHNISSLPWMLVCVSTISAAAANRQAWACMCWGKVWAAHTQLCLTALRPSSWLWWLLLTRNSAFLQMAIAGHWGVRGAQKSSLLLCCQSVVTVLINM